ncbi:MAG: hypothetical protein ACOYYU_11130 [Chloroflexota bacterium]
MKLIDQTPLQNYKGEIKLLDRLKGTLKYGPSWYPELQAQKTVIQLLDRILVKGFILIRNCTLPGSQIIIPLILIGPPGVTVAYVTHLRGTYMAKGDSWRIMRGNTFQPTAVNLLTRVEGYTRALKVFIERQGAKRALSIDPVLLAANPGMYIESQRPTVRIVMSDALERWATGVLQSPPLLSPDHVEQLADRIVNPRPPKRQTAAQQPETASQPGAGSPESELSRAQAIFRASENAESFDPADLGFAFDEGQGPEIPRQMVETSPAVPVSARSSAGKRYFGMSGRQLALLGGMALVEICILLCLAGFFLFFPQ